MTTNKTLNNDGVASPKLLLLCQLFYPELVSTGQTLTELCEELSAMGMDIEVVCGQQTVINRGGNVPNKMQYKGILINRVWGTSFPKLNLFGRIVNQATYALSVFIYLLLDRSKRPVLVLTNPPYLAFICAFFSALVGRRYLYLVFDVYPDTAIKLGLLKQGGFISELWNRLNSFSYKQASGIIVIGRCMQDLIKEKLGGEGCEKLSLIHVWSDDLRIGKSSDVVNPYVEKWGLEGKFVLLYSGNMGRFHDMETIMKAAKELREHSDIVFVFVGDGHKKEWAINFAESNGLENCQFHGYVPREDLPLSLSTADVGLVSLMQGQEGLSVPSKAYGLMSAGLPVVAVMSERSEIARVIREEECGFVVSPGDVSGLHKAILQLYNNVTLKEDMGMFARESIDKRYNLKNASEKFFQLIEKL